MARTFTSLFKDETGATAIEYGLIATLVSIAAITAMQNLGNELSTTYNSVETKVQAANQRNQ
ncbi:Flp family type IVb pilin [Aurantiacibacter sp. D1-12]|uniref:Flp family type IVb pilin n=1 Tax=Aurantiacibacter sp. D1-12 TaxID=2993658 RepID=UPI00237D11F1|nr:Flp family type IVb pilin [Aurantiacibacter sp. D1-12]MDE1468322.1 Flp family type IVb pilin [Aurantiacibacter sp. D1-12]